MQLPTYQVFVDDNFYYMDEGSRYAVGKFFDYASALAKAKGIVDESLDDTYEPGMSAEECWAELDCGP